MSEMKDGGPAFPVELDWSSGAPHGKQTDNNTGWHEGLTLRDYYASKAMQALIDPVKFQRFDLTRGMVREECERVANRAYEFADAMLRARGQA